MILRNESTSSNFYSSQIKSSQTSYLCRDIFPVYPRCHLFSTVPRVMVSFHDRHLSLHDLKINFTHSFFNVLFLNVYIKTLHALLMKPMVKILDNRERLFVVGSFNILHILFFNWHHETQYRPWSPATNEEENNNKHCLGSLALCCMEAEMHF